MAYFADIWTGATTEISGITYQHNEVINVIVIDDCNEYLLSGNTMPGTWVKTCPDGAFRKTYAGKGMIYDEENDMFIKKQPYPSWTLNTDTGEWDPPTPAPGDDYYWDEDTLSWTEIPFPSPSPSPTPGLSPTPTPTPPPSVTPSEQPQPSVSPIPE